MKRIKQAILWALVVFGVFIIDNIKRAYHWAFNPDTGYFLKYRYYYCEGEPCIYYVICHGYRFLGIPLSDRVAFCYDMYEVNKIAKAKKITIK